MSYRHPMAAIKSTAEQKIKDTKVGCVADLVAHSVIRQLQDDKELAVVYVKRRSPRDWTGYFLPAIGVEAETILHDQGFDLHFDSSASMAASQESTPGGYGCKPRQSWSPNHLGFVFSRLALAEVIQLGQTLPETRSVPLKEAA